MTTNGLFFYGGGYRPQPQAVSLRMLFVRRSALTTAAVGLAPADTASAAPTATASGSRYTPLDTARVFAGTVGSPSAPFPHGPSRHNIRW